MLSALLLPLLLAGPHAGAPSDSNAAVRLWINHDGRFLPGDNARIEVQTKDSGYLLVLHADPDGQLQVLFPLDPGDNNFVRGGERYEVKGREGDAAFAIQVTSGRGMVYAAVSSTAFRFDSYRREGHWDYHALAPSPLPREPEAELSDLVRGMAQGDFDYDVVTYDVMERVVYASDNSSGPFFVSGDSFFGFSPFFNPFVFDPFFQRPFFFHPFLRQPIFFDPFLNPFVFDPFIPRGFFFDPFLPQRFFFDPFFCCQPFLQQPVLANPFFNRPFIFGRRGVGPVPFRDRRSDFSRAATLARRVPWRAQGLVTASRGLRPIGERRLSHWPVDVSPHSRELANMARRDNWPVDVTPRLRGLSLPTARRAEIDRGAALRPQMDPGRLAEGRRGRIEKRPGIEPAPIDRGGWEGFSHSSGLRSRGGLWGWSQRGLGGLRGFGRR